MKRASSLSLVVMACAAATVPVAAVNVNWTNPDTGLWNDPLNWDLGVPTPADTPRINNGGTASIEAGDFMAGLTQVGGATGTTGNLEISGGSLTVTGDLRIGGSGASGTGVMTLSGGRVSMDPGNFNIGFGPTAGGASGTVNVSGGSILVKNTATASTTAIMAVGNRGTGHLNQSGGDIFLVSSTAALPGVLNLGRGSSGIGDGTYTLSGGNCTTAELRFGNAVLPAGTNTFTLSGTGFMTAGLISIINTGATNIINFTGGTLAAAAVNFPLTNNGGTLKPGVFDFTAATAAEVLTDPTGTLTFGTNFSYTQNSGTLAIDIDGAGSNDLVSIGTGASSGNAVLAGTIAVNLLGGYDPPPGTTFDIVTADGIANSAAITGLTPGGFRFAPSIVDGADGRKVLRLRVALLEPDADEDDMGDLWEAANGLNTGEDDSALDPDLDTLTNIQEYTKGTNPRDSDTDDDLLRDDHESATGIWVSPVNTGTNPLLPDTDADGLSDGLENPGLPWIGPAQPGSNPNKPDTDGDLFPDGVEIAQGLNPTDPLSLPNPATGSTLALDFNSDQTAAPATQTGFVSLDPASGWQGTFGPLSVTVSTVGFCTIDDRDREAAGAGGGFNPLFRDFIFASLSDEDGDGLEVTVTGLAPLQTYPVSLWSWDPGSAGTPRHSTWYATDGNNGLAVKVPLYILSNAGQPPALFSDRRMKFDARTDSSGTLVIRGLKEEGYFGNLVTHNVFLNGLMIGPPVTPLAVTSAGPLAGGSFPLTWTSDAAASYRVERSGDLLTWTIVNDSISGAAGTTTFTDTNIPADAGIRFYRVARTSP